MLIKVRESIGYCHDLDVCTHTPILYDFLLSQLIEPLEHANNKLIDCFINGEDEIIVSIEDWMDSTVLQTLQQYCNYNNLSNYFIVKEINM